ncbi:hypothetical protein L2737_06320 [Shewanella electrodiphila]|uniref:Uncharacterized protein n=1 Tax=Shewanella electrodiphila TaxID=934143 RepID=A0ABT0KM65_9GAMM|nr:hypothetical protein [Shewanella electrodiphila]MCL1044943.1 hypothetical protein [Shewanella electrodiphila]
MDDDIKGAVITAQTGWNEAFLVGTEKELLDFAQNIIDSVRAAKEDELFGEKVKTINLLGGKLASHSEVQFDWLAVTKDSEQTLEISHKVQGL